jgi:WD40 repeat protein
VAFSPNEQLFAAAWMNGVITLWDVQRKKVCGKFNRGPSYVSGLMAFSPDSRILAYTSNVGLDNACLWDVLTGRLRTLKQSYSGVMTAMAFSPDCRALALAHQDGMIDVWDVRTGASFSWQSGQQGAVQLMAFSSDSQLLSCVAGALHPALAA